jgi:hypothetical protein
VHQDKNCIFAHKLKHFGKSQRLFGFPHQLLQKESTRDEGCLLTRTAWALVVFGKVDRGSSLDGLVVYY